MMMGEPSTLLLRRASGPANLVQKFRATAALYVSTGKQKPQIDVRLLSGGSRLARLPGETSWHGGGRRKELKTTLREAWTLQQLIVLRGKRERRRSVGAYGVLAGLFLGGRSYWATGREQRTVAPCAIGSLAFFFF